MGGKSPTESLTGPLHLLIKVELIDQFRLLQLKISTLAAQRYNNDLITITNNGPGIAVQDHSKIFEMFYRISANAPVSGLGLYICKEILNKVEGEIWFESDFGKGTVFLIRLPN